MTSNLLFPAASNVLFPQILETTLDSEISNYLNRCEMLQRHREIGDANKAFLYMLACGMLKSARQRPSVRDPEKPNQVIAEAREMADEDRLIIFDLQINDMPETQKRDLIVHLGAAVHSNQWRSTPHFRRAAMHIIIRERGLLRGRGQEEATTTQLISQLWRKAEALLK